MYDDGSDNCQICGESPTGCHYGVWCCNSCKCFFRRCVIQKGHYRCRTGQNQCEIAQESRNACRACRYAKCIAVGLNPEKMAHNDSATAAVLQLSHPSGSNTPDEPVAQKGCSTSSNTLAASSAMAVALKNRSCKGATDLSAYHRPHLPTPSILAIQISSSLPLGSISGLLSHQCVLNDPLSNYFILAERLCESYRDTPLNCASPQVAYNLNIPIERAFLEPRSLIPRTAIDWEARFPMTPEAGYLLPRQWCRSVAFFSDWASHIPELQLLDLDDMVQILPGRVKQCNWLWVASRSIRLAAGKLVFFGGGGCYPLDPAEQALMNPEVNKFIQPLCNLLNTEIIRPALDMQVREEELALLKVLCFCVPVAGLKAYARVIIQSAQAKYQAALVEEVMKHSAGEGVFGNIGHQADGRLTKMMSWLGAVERIAEEGNKHFSLMTLFNISEMKGSLPYELHVRSG